MFMSEGFLDVSMQIAAAVPAACPMANTGGITLMAARATRSSEQHLPATRRLLIFFGSKIL